MSSDYSEDDMPLARPNGHLSAATISKAEDKAMDHGDSHVQSLPAPVSIRHGPVKDEDAMDVDTPQTNGNGKRKSRGSIPKVSYKDESDSDDGPLAKRRKQAESDDSDDDVPLTTRKRLPPQATEKDLIDNDSDDDKPIALKLAQQKKEIEDAASKQAKVKKPNSKKVKEESDDDVPLSKPKKRLSNGTSSQTNGVKKAADSDSDSDAPIRKKVNAKPKPTAATKAKAGKAAATKGKVEKSTPVKKAAAKKSKKEESEEPGEEEAEEYRWWDAPKKEDDSIKWNTLEHNGVIFPPPYEPLPKNIKLVYDATPVNLHVDAEEVAGFFGAMLNSTHNVENPVFQKNFFGDFQEILKKTGGAKDAQGNKVAIKEFSKLNFDQIFQYYSSKNEARKARPAAEKKTEKAEKDKLEAPYMYCKWDGRKEKVGNFRVEPPGLFRGRGEHPKTGKVKHRVMPEQITLNLGKGAEIPPAPKGHKWKAVQHDNKATWLAMWQENINGAYKYVMLAANSSVKGQSDYKKFEKARELKNHIDRIRKDYERELKAQTMADRQRATAMYLIDKLALRAGNEKDAENEAETVGCCSLKYEHVTLKEPDTLIFDFLGKDSIRYYDEVKVDRQVFKNFIHFKKAPKKEGDDIFDRLNTSQLNKHLSNYMPGLTAKVFRTYNASFTMSQLLKKIKNDKKMTVAEKIATYNAANKEVAVLCNHKRTTSANHADQMAKMEDRIKALKYQKWRTKMMILGIDPKQKKKKGAEFFELDDDLTEEWVTNHLKALVEEQRTKIEKKYQKDNEKHVADGEKPLPDKELKERMKVVVELDKKLQKEHKTKKVEAEGKGPTVAKLETKLNTFDERIQTAKVQAGTREELKEVALGTSKINYIDPRLTVVFSKKMDVPIEKFFSKTLREKFNWAIKSVEDDENWEF